MRNKNINNKYLKICVEELGYVAQELDNSIYYSSVFARISENIASFTKKQQTADLTLLVTPNANFAFFSQERTVKQ